MDIAGRLEQWIPKSHLVYHLILRAAYHGNPVLYHTFLDESLNSTLKKVLRLCHQCRFETQGLAKIEKALSSFGQKRKL